MASKAFKSNISFTRPDTVDEVLYVVTPVFNPHRYRARWKLYQQFETHVLNSGAHLITIECSFGERQEALVEQASENHTVKYVYTNDEIWLKENLINLAIQSLPKTAKYVAWVDADIQFVRPDWVGETLQKLQHYHVVQMFSVCYELTAQFNPYQINYGFMYDYINGFFDKIKNKKKDGTDDYDYSYYDYYYHNDDCPECKGHGLKMNRLHPGYAWAYTIEAFNALGGLMEFPILGAADHHMALALTGNYERSLPNNMNGEYRELVKIWQDRAMNYVKKDIGYVDGQINHFFHGAKKYRRYKERWQILVENDYNPKTDIKKIFNGTMALDDNKIKIRDDIRAYFGQRNEDSIDLEDDDRLVGL